MRFRMGLVGAARSGKKSSQVVVRQRAVQAPAALAGRDREQPVLRKPIEELQDAGEKQHRVLAGEKVFPVLRSEIWIALGAEARHGEAQRIVQAEADDVARALPVRYLETHIARRILDAADDRARPNDQRPLPVEDHEPVFHWKVFFANAAISAGSFDSKLSFSFSIGC